MEEGRRGEAAEGEGEGFKTRARHKDEAEDGEVGWEGGAEAEFIRGRRPLNAEGLSTSTG